MVNRMNQFGKGLRKDREDTNQNTRRYSANFPHVERKLDVIETSVPYTLEFKTKNRPHSVRLNLRVRPDNCCDCDAGAQTQAREAVIMVDSWGPDTGTGRSDGNAYPAIINDNVLNTGTIYHWVTLPIFWGPLAQPYESFGGYVKAPDGKGVIVPVDGVYNFLFQNIAHGALEPDSAIRASIMIKPPPDPDNPLYIPVWEEVAYRNYSQALGNISTLHEWPLSTLSIWVYAMCIPMKAGTQVDGWLQATDIINWSPGIGGIDANKMAIALLGLGYGSLEGYVLSAADGSPVDNAQVHLLNADFQYQGAYAYTDINGHYLFEDITPKSYTVQCDGLTTTIVVKFNETARLDFNI